MNQRSLNKSQSKFKVGDIIQHDYVKHAEEGVIKKIDPNGYLHITWYKWRNADGHYSSVDCVDPPENIHLFVPPQEAPQEELTQEEMIEI